MKEQYTCKLHEHFQEQRRLVDSQKGFPTMEALVSSLYVAFGKEESLFQTP